MSICSLPRPISLRRSWSRAEHWHRWPAISAGTASWRRGLLRSASSSPAGQPPREPPGCSQGWPKPWTAPPGMLASRTRERSNEEIGRRGRWGNEGEEQKGGNQQGKHCHPFSGLAKNKSEEQTNYGSKCFSGVDNSEYKFIFKIWKRVGVRNWQSIETLLWVQ